IPERLRRRQPSAVNDFISRSDICMDELIEHLMRRLRGMWRRRWIGLGVAWIVAIIGVVVVYRIPERYEASARVYVDTQSLLRPLLAGLAIQPNLAEQAALIIRTLVARPNAQRLRGLARLDHAVASHPPKH